MKRLIMKAASRRRKNGEGKRELGQQDEGKPELARCVTGHKGQPSEEGGAGGTVKGEKGGK